MLRSLIKNFRNTRSTSVIAAKAAISLFSNIPSLRGVQRRRNPEWAALRLWIAASLTLLAMTGTAFAATSIPFTINTSEAVNVTGTPRIAVDVGGVTRYATYTSGSGTNALTFTYTMVAGDVDLDGVALSSPIDLNGGTIKDLNGNDATLTFTPPNTSNVKVNYPSLGMDFVADADGRYTLNGTVYNDLTSFLTAAGGTFTRASTATYFDLTGTLQTAASGVPRFDYDPVTHAAKGILIEESRTNLIPNGQGIGASGTSYPTGWSQDQAFGGISASSTSSGTDTYGYGYFQYTISGTTTLGNRLLINPYTAKAPVTAGQSYTVTYGIQLVSGTYPYLITSNITWYDSSNVQLSSSSATNHTPTGSVTRYSDTFTAPANAAKARIWFDHNGYGTPGTSVNFTLRLSAIQLEQGAFATSYIPTTTAAATRAADVLTVPTGGWYAPAQGTLFAAFDRSGQGSGGYGTAGIVAQLRTSDANSTDIYTASRGNPVGAEVKFANTFPAYLNIVKPAGTSKASTTFNTAGGSVSIDGTVQSFGIAAAVPTFSELTIGRSNRAGGQNWLNTSIEKVKYYPLRISDTQLQLLTQ